MSNNLKKDIRKSSGTNSLMILLFIVTILGISFLLSLIFTKLPGYGTARMYTIQTMIIYIFQYAVLVPIILLIYFKTKSGKAAPKLKSSLCKPKIPASQVIKWMVISLAVIYLSSYISTFIFTMIQLLTGQTLHPATIDSDLSALNIFTNILSVMFLAPIFEEAFFRASLLRSCARYGSWSMIIAMGIMFGLWHVNYAQTIYTITLGICAGFLLIKSGSIIPSLLIHFIMNTIGTIQTFIIGNVDAQKLSSGDISYIMENITPVMISAIMGFLVIAIMITGLVLLVIELVRHRLDGFRLPSDYTEISEKRKLAVYFSSPITIAVTAGLICFTVYNALFL